MRHAHWIALSLLTVSSHGETIRAIKLDHAAPIPAETKLASALAAFQAKEFTTGTADEITSLIVSHYQAQDFPVVQVSLPDDACQKGVLTVQVTEGRVGNVTQTGHRWLATSRPRLQTGDFLTGVQLQKSLDDLNRNPFHRATVAATPGATPDVADLRFDLPQEMPLSAWLSFSNDGIRPLGEARWLAGVSAGDLFHFDNTLTLQGQMAEDFKTYHALLGEWKNRLPWHHEIALTGAFVQTQSPDVDDISVAGEAWFANAKYLVPWRTSVSCAGEAWLGFDAKHFATDVFFGGQSALRQPLDVATFSLGGKLNWTHKRDTLELSTEATYSPGGLWGHSSDENYNAGVPGASSQFFYARAQATWTHTWQNRSSVITSLGGQWADGTLLASEAFYLTGANAVRGYRERALVGSSGVRGSIEARTPFIPMPLLPQTQAQAVFFADAGHTWTEQVLTETPVALGTGIRAQLGRWGQVRCEAAWPLTDALPPRIHVQMTLFF
jgi:hemolysin activation/secretion protein